MPIELSKVPAAYVARICIAVREGFCREGRRCRVVVMNNITAGHTIKGQIAVGDYTVRVRDSRLSVEATARPGSAQAGQPTLALGPELPAEVTSMTPAASSVPNMSL